MLDTTALLVSTTSQIGCHKFKVGSHRSQVTDRKSTEGTDTRRKVAAPWCHRKRQKGRTGNQPALFETDDVRLAIAETCRLFYSVEFLRTVGYSMPSCSR